MYFSTGLVAPVTFINIHCSCMSVVRVDENCTFLCVIPQYLLQLILCSLEDFHVMKNKKREAMDLPPLTEDTHEVCKHMRASSPPASAADLIEAQQQPRRNTRGSKKVGT